jgi:hypothetical protein
LSENLESYWLCNFRSCKAGSEPCDETIKFQKISSRNGSSRERQLCKTFVSPAPFRGVTSARAISTKLCIFKERLYGNFRRELVISALVSSMNIATKQTNSLMLRDYIAITHTKCCRTSSSSPSHPHSCTASSLSRRLFHESDKYNF